MAHSFEEATDKEARERTANLEDMAGIVDDGLLVLKRMVSKQLWHNKISKQSASLPSLITVDPIYMHGIIFAMADVSDDVEEEEKQATAQPPAAVLSQPLRTVTKMVAQKRATGGNG